MVLDEERTVVGLSRSWKRRSEPGKFHAGNGTHTAQSLADKRGLRNDGAIGIRFGILGYGKPDAGDDQARRIESGVFLKECREGTEQEAGADRQHDRESQFRNDQQAAQTRGVFAVARAARIITNRMEHFCFCGLQSGGQPKEKAREDGNCQCEEKNGQVHAHVIHNRGITGGEPSASRAATTPASPASSDKSKDSVINWRTMRERLAPSVKRRAISPCLPDARANRRPAMLTDATRMMRTTVTIKTSIIGRMSPTND